MVGVVSSYHGTGNKQAKSSSEWHHQAIKIQEYPTTIKKISMDYSRAKGQEIEKTLKEADLQHKVNAYMLSKETFKRALEHDCFYDVISEDHGNVTIIILPFSTSVNRVFCGIQKFDKIHLMINGLKNFYITRILFNVTMTRADFEKWEAASKLRYQDFKFRKKLFNEIQKDLDKNQYSILKDTDLVESNLDFFTKELPLIKFKFTDYVC